MRRVLPFLSAVIVLLSLTARGTDKGGSMQLTSSAFAAGAAIPSKYTCDGANVSPPLSWTSTPAGTKSFAIIVDDPDAPDPAAPKMVWVHWVLYNLPATSNSLPEAVRDLQPATLDGKNDWKKTGYGGPCPPIGRHRYFHSLYALDTTLPDLKNPTKAELLAAMQGHVLARAELIGTYQRGKG